MVRGPEPCVTMSESCVTMSEPCVTMSGTLGVDLALSGAGL